MSAHACTQLLFHFHTLKIKRLGRIRRVQTKVKDTQTTGGCSNSAFQPFPRQQELRWQAVPALGSQPFREAREERSGKARTAFPKTCARPTRCPDSKSPRKPCKLGQAFGFCPALVAPVSENPLYSSHQSSQVLSGVRLGKPTTNQSQPDPSVHSGDAPAVFCKGKTPARAL